MLPYMSQVTRTTVYLDTADYRRLKVMARAEGKSAAELIREAVSEYARRQPERSRPSSLGVGHSGRGDLSERAEDRLAGMGREP
jgi:predicted transcriptional regulator